MAKLSPTLAAIALSEEDKAKLYERHGVRWAHHEPKPSHGNLGQVRQTYNYKKPYASTLKNVQK